MSYHLLKIAHLSAIVLMALLLGYILRNKSPSKIGLMSYFILSLLALASGVFLLNRWEMIDPFGLWMQIKTVGFIFLLFVPWIHLYRNIPRVLTALVFVSYLIVVFFSTTKIY